MHFVFVKLPQSLLGSAAMLPACPAGSSMHSVKALVQLFQPSGNLSQHANLAAPLPPPVVA